MGKRSRNNGMNSPKSPFSGPVRRTEQIPEPFSVISASGNTLNIPLTGTSPIYNNTSATIFSSTTNSSLFGQNSSLAQLSSAPSSAPTTNPFGGGGPSINNPFFGASSSSEEINNIFGGGSLPFNASTGSDMV